MIKRMLTPDEIRALSPSATAAALLPLCDETRQQYLDAAERRAKEILNTPSLSPTEITGQCWYVANDGDDRAGGTSPETAWQSMERLTQAQTDGTIQPGDGVFFARGSVWNAAFPTRWSGDYALRLKSGVTYSAYGCGDRPMFTNCLCGEGGENWLPTAYENVWRFARNVGSGYSDIGNLVFDDGRAYGIKILPSHPPAPFAPGSTALDRGMVTNGLTHFHSGGTPLRHPGDLRHNLEFLHDHADGWLYLYWDGGNPGVSFRKIRIARRGHILRCDNPTEDVHIDSICVKYGGSHGLATDKATRVTVQNSVFGWIGGSLQSGDDDSTTQYGNGIENWGSCDGFSVQNCIVYQCYDAALTTQYHGDDPHEGIDMHNVRFCGNVLAYNDYAVEIFNNPPQSNTPPYGNQISDARFCDNHMLYAGYHFGHQRLDKNGNFGRLGGPVFTDTVMSGNRFLFAAAYAHHTPFIRLGDSPIGVALENNVYMIGADKAMLRSCTDPVHGTGDPCRYPYDADCLGVLQALGMDRNSVFYVYDTPLFPEEEDGVYQSNC